MEHGGPNAKGLSDLFYYGCNLPCVIVGLVFLYFLLVNSGNFVIQKSKMERSFWK